jgi:hypothetical protein
LLHIVKDAINKYTMRITEIIQTKSASAVAESKAQDVVAQDIVPYNGDSAIMEGVSQILRRVKGKGLKPGFRCTSGYRKGRIVAKPSTCFAKRDTVKGAKIAKKRQIKARQAGKKMGITKRSGGASRRLQRAQLKTGTKLDRPKLKTGGRRLRARPAFRSTKVAKPK